MIPTAKGDEEGLNCFGIAGGKRGGRARVKRELSNSRANRYPVNLRGKAQNASEGLVAKLSESPMRRHQGKDSVKVFQQEYSERTMGKDRKQR